MGIGSPSVSMCQWLPVPLRVEEVAEGHVEVACLVLEHGVDATVQDKQGSTLLHWASYAGQADVTRLLGHGVDATV